MNLALFDFDGTITTREMFPDFLHFAVAPMRVAVGKALLWPLIVGYRLGIVSGNRVRASIVKFGFRGMQETSAQRFGEHFFAEVLPETIRPNAFERIQWHKSQGDIVVIVSGSFDLYLKHWCRLHDIELLCSTLEVENGVLTGRYRGEQCVGKEKARRIHENYDLQKFPIVYAYGDTKEDMDMLNLATKKYYCWQEMI